MRKFLLARRPAKAVIGYTFVAVLQNSMGLIDFLETLFGTFLFVIIGMPFKGELAKGGFDLRIASMGCNVKNVVRIFSDHDSLASRLSSRVAQLAAERP